MSRIKIEMPETYLFSTLLPIRIGDINYGGHLGNDAVLSMVHESRVRFLKNYGYTEQDIEGAGLIMTDTAIVYKAEAFHGELIQVEVTIGEFNRYGCDFFFLLSNKDTAIEVAHVKTGVVFFNYAERKVVSMPPEFKSSFIKEL